MDRIFDDEGEWAVRRGGVGERRGVEGVSGSGVVEPGAPAGQAMLAGGFQPPGSLRGESVAVASIDVKEALVMAEADPVVPTLTRRGALRMKIPGAGSPRLTSEVPMGPGEREVRFAGNFDHDRDGHATIR